MLKGCLKRVWRLKPRLHEQSLPTRTTEGQGFKNRRCLNAVRLEAGDRPLGMAALVFVSLRQAYSIQETRSVSVAKRPARARSVQSPRVQASRLLKHLLSSSDHKSLQLKQKTRETLF